MKLKGLLKMAPDMVTRSDSVNNFFDEKASNENCGNCKNAISKQGGRRTSIKLEHKEKPLLSVITPVYNRLNSIGSTIQSVIAQISDQIEYLVIDGGSSDGTVDIINGFSNQIDYWISERDSGVYDAINKGIELSKGKWIYVLGSGDVLYKNSLGTALKQISRQDTIYYGNVYCPSQKKKYGGHFNAIRILYENIPHQAAFYPKRVFETTKYNTAYPVCADYDLAIRTFFNRSFKFKYLPFIIAEYEDNVGLSKEIRDVSFSRNKKQIIINNAPLLTGLLYRLLRLGRVVYRNPWQKK